MMKEVDRWSQLSEIEKGWRMLSASIVSLAITDLAMIGDFTHETPEKMQDDAAWFFADDLHRAYCIICNRDAMAIKQRAIDIAKVIKSKGNRSFRNERQPR